MLTRDDYDANAAAELKRRRTFRKFSYRGIELDQLLDLSNEEFVDLVHARARRRFQRGLKRGPMALIKKLRKAKKEAPSNEKPAVVKTHLRNMIVVPEMIGSVVGIYNGKVFTTVEIKPEMTGHYLGEFAISYIPTRHGKSSLGKNAYVSYANQRPLRPPVLSECARGSPRDDPTALQSMPHSSSRCVRKKDEYISHVSGSALCMMYDERRAVWLDILQRWAELARKRSADLANVYVRAHRALAHHQGELEHPYDTVALPGIGEKTATRLEAAYERWCHEHGVEMPQRTHASSESAPRRARKRQHVRKYIPAPRSGAHGILVALYIKAGDPDAPGAAKPELISLAQPYCNSDYSVPSSTPEIRSLALRRGGGRAFGRSHITAWNSIKTLIDKEYVYKSGNPPVYTLSEHGLEVARALAEAEGIDVSEDQQDGAQEPGGSGRPFDSDDDLEPAVVVDLVATSDDEVFTTRVTQQDPATPAKQPVSISLIDSSPLISPANPTQSQSGIWAPDRSVVLDAGTYDIILVIDHREVRQRPQGGARVTFEDALAQRNIPCELRALELGDVIWIARPRSGLSDTQQVPWRRTGDVVLDVVVERKRLDDLTSSIVDGRWHDQKVCNG